MRELTTAVASVAQATESLDLIPNMYADLSAGSGYNAITRDPEWTEGFLERNWQKLLFATDYTRMNDPLPQIKWVRETPMSDEMRAAIMEGNARKVFKIEG